MIIQNIHDLFAGTYLNLKETQFVDKNGKKGFWTWVQRTKNQNAVVIVAVVQNPVRLLVIKEFRVPIQDYEWGFPAGLIESHEKPANAAKRELFEETGLTVSKIRHVSPLIYNTSGLTDEGSYMAFVEAVGLPNNKNNEESEDIETFLMTQSEVNDILHRPDIKFGAKAYLVMKFFAKHGDIYT